jgi:multicomponent Na+:H+ antiporter subunit G
MQDLVASVLLAGGAFFLVVAAIGFVRLPDVFCRLHVTGVIDTLGAPLVLLGAAVLVGADLVALKLVLGILFLVVTSPLVGHLLARAAVQSEHEPGVIEEGSRAPLGDGIGPEGSGEVAMILYFIHARHRPGRYLRRGADPGSRPVRRGRAALRLQRTPGHGVRAHGRRGRGAHRGGGGDERLHRLLHGADVVDPTRTS